MTESFIRDVAKRFDLEVLKRITTGGSKRHFATFELFGTRSVEAWQDMSSHGRGHDFDCLRRSDNFPNDWYIECDSVWCE